MWIQRLTLSMALAGSGLSCARTLEAQPGDMGVAEHEAAAQIEEKRSLVHAEHGDQGGDAFGGCTGTIEVSGVCWTSRAEPSARHRQQARRHQNAAASHRQAAAQLEAVEARACSSVAASDRDQSPFSRSEDIVSAEVDEAGKRAVVTFRSVPGLSLVQLQRIVDCHLARNGSLGHQVEGMEYCPLVPAGVSAVVSEAPQGQLSVAISAQTEQSRAEVYDRVRKLELATTRSSSPR